MNYSRFILVGLASCALSALSLRAQSTVLNYNSTGYVTANAPLQGATSGFSDRDARSPADFAGPAIYGGLVAAGGGAVVDQWLLYNDADGDGPRFRLSATSPTGASAAVVCLWSRDDFASGYRDVPIDLSASTNSLSFAGRLYGSASTKLAHFIVQDATGDYFITSGSWTIPSTFTTVTFANPAGAAWTKYNPATNATSTGMPDFTKIFAVGVRLSVAKSNGTSSLSVQLNSFTASAASVSNTDSVMSLTARAASDTRVNLGWTANASAQSYRVYRSTTSGVKGPLVKSMAINACQEFRLNPVNRYYYTVEAVDPAGTVLATSSQILVLTDVAEGVVARHPSLHFSAKEIPDLKQKITTAPWSTWYAQVKTNALNYVNFGGVNNARNPATFDPSATGFIECTSRGDVVVALATVWLLDSDATLRSTCLAELKNYLANIPAPPSTTPVIADITDLITVKNTNGSLPNPYFYASALSVSYPSRGYALAYDMVFPTLTGSERADYSDRIRKHAELLFDPVKQWNGQNQSINAKANNWVDVIAGGLAMSGAVLRDLPNPSTPSQTWGQAYMETALENLQRVVVSDLHTKGDGAYIEGEVYGAFAGYWASEAMQAFRAANFDVSPAVGELFQDTHYQAWLKFRTQNLLQGGRPALFEAAREMLDDSQRWVSAYAFEQADPAVQARLLWLRSLYLNSSSAETAAALFRYPLGPTAATTSAIIQPVPAASYVDPVAGLAFFRSGSPSSTSGDEANSLSLAHSNKPYRGTILGTMLDPAHITKLSHFRCSAGTFEAWAYGSHVISEPGYYTGANQTATVYSHVAWADQDAESHNTLKIDGNSPYKYAASEGFSHWSTGHSLEFVSGIVAAPFVPFTTNIPQTLPTPSGSLERTILFVRPTASPGYFVVFDNVVTGANTAVDWFLHGMGNTPTSTSLSLSGKGATWSGVVPQFGGGANVNLTAYQATPNTSMPWATMTKAFYEYQTGATSGIDADFVKSSTIASKQFVTVLFPWKSTSSAPSISDVTNGSVVVGAQIGSDDIAASQAGNTAITVGSVTSDALSFFARKNSNGVELDSYFAHEGGSLLFNAGTVGFVTSGPLIDIVVDTYDATTKKLRGTICYLMTGTPAAFDLTIRHGQFPASGTSVVLTPTLAGTPSAAPTPVVSAGEITFQLPAAALAHYEFEITVP